jgi:hypothetical protein
VTVDAVIGESPAIEVDVIVSGVVQFKPLTHQVVHGLWILHDFGDDDSPGGGFLRLDFALFVTPIIGHSVFIVTFFPDFSGYNAIPAVRIAVGAILGAVVATFVAIAGSIATNTLATVISAGHTVFAVFTVVISAFSLAFATIFGAGDTGFIPFASAVVADTLVAIIRTGTAILTLFAGLVATLCAGAIRRTGLTGFLIVTNFVSATVTTIRWAGVAILFEVALVVFTAVSTICRAGIAILVAIADLVTAILFTDSAIVRTTLAVLPLSAGTVTAGALATVFKALDTVLFVRVTEPIAADRFDNFEFTASSIHNSGIEGGSIFADIQIVNGQGTGCGGNSNQQGQQNSLHHGPPSGMHAQAG